MIILLQFVIVVIIPEVLLNNYITTIEIVIKLQLIFNNDYYYDKIQNTVEKFT